MASVFAMFLNFRHPNTTVRKIKKALFEMYLLIFALYGQCICNVFELSDSKHYFTNEEGYNSERSEDEHEALVLLLKGRNGGGGP